MEVILMERVETLGQMGDVVKVKPGYARNYLLPRKKALRATSDNKALFEARRTQLEATNLERRREAEALSKRLDGLHVVVIRSAAESGQLYGSVSARDIAQAITEAGVSVDRRQVELNQAIKTLGLIPIRVALHPEVKVDVTINVARSHDQAELQRQRGGRVVTEREMEEADAVRAAEEAADYAEQKLADQAEASAEPGEDTGEDESRA